MKYFNKPVNDHFLGFTAQTQELRFKDYDLLASLSDLMVIDVTLKLNKIINA